MKNQTKFFLHQYKLHIIVASVITIAIIAYAVYYQKYTALDTSEKSADKTAESTTTTGSSMVSDANEEDPHSIDYNMIRVAGGKKISNRKTGVSYNTHPYWTDADKTQIIDKGIPGLDFSKTTFSSATFLDFELGKYIGIVVFYEKTDHSDAALYLRDYKKRLDNLSDVEYQFDDNPVATKKQPKYTLGSLLSRYQTGSVVYYQQYMSVINNGYATTFACYYTNEPIRDGNNVYDSYDSQLPLLSIIRSITLQ